MKNKTVNQQTKKRRREKRTTNKMCATTNKKQMTKHSKSVRTDKYTQNGKLAKTETNQLMQQQI